MTSSVAGWLPSNPSMPLCIYCDRDKDGAEMSLEHVIPQFLGGAYAPDRFKTDRACASCNHWLGLFVDGSFARASLVSKWLSMSALPAYDPVKPFGLPLICMGPCDLRPPGMRPEEICECWLGPQGEQVYWIRPHYERFYWYSGGDPINTQEIETRAYFSFCEGTLKDPLKTWLAFRDAFRRENVTKIMCTEINGSNPKTIGFSEPGEIDSSRISYFVQRCVGSSHRIVDVPTNFRYDYRFMAKLALGVGYSVFGDAYLATDYAKELRAGVWFRDVSGAPPKIFGQTPLGATPDPQFLKMTGMLSAITLILFPVHTSLVLILNLGRQLVWQMTICQRAELADSPAWAWIGLGQVIALYPYLKGGVSLEYSEFIGHVMSRRPHSALADIERQLKYPNATADSQG